MTTRSFSGRLAAPRLALLRPAFAHPLLVRLLALAAPAVLAPAWAQDLPAAAQKAAGTLPETVVAATRTEQPLAEVLADVTLIGAQEIARSGAASVADVLARQPGVALARNGGPGTTTSLYVRGGESRFTAVYIDGVRVDTQSTGGAPWEALALDQVERIEILRGPAAAVYGSDAMAGVVLIFTRQGRDAARPFMPYAGLGAGSRRAGRLEAGFAGKSGALDYALGASRDVSRGYNIQPAGTPDADGWQQNSASARLGWQMAQAHRLDVSGSHARMDARYDGFAPGQDDHALNRLGTLGATWSAQWSPRYSSRLSVSQSRHQYETRPSPYLSRTTLRNYLLQNEWRQGAHLLTATLERREDRLRNDPIGRQRHQNALALGWGWTQGAHLLQLNLRHDKDSEFGGQASGSAAYGWAFAPGWRATAAAGTAFRVPTLYQRFSPYGQAGLQPEKGRNAEIGLHYAQGAHNAALTLYRNRVRNLISFGAAGPCASSFGCYENTGRALYQGLTLSGGTRLGGVNLSGSLDLMRPKDSDSGKLLARRPRRMLKLAADTVVHTGAQAWTLGAEWQLSSMRYDNAANTRRLGGYGLLNLYASATLARDWQLLARIDNAGGKAYQLARGYDTPGRSFWLGLRWAPR